MQLLIKPKTKPSKSQETKVDDLILKRKSGGSIIDQRPLFSQDGEMVYVVWKQVIRAYSAKTGDFVKELEPAKHKIISITLSPENSDTILGCTDSGEILYWNSQNGLITMKTQLLIPDKDVKIKTFHIAHYTRFKKYVCNAVITYIVKQDDAKILCIQMYDMILGTKTLYQKLKNFNEVYYIDIVGNHGENLITIAYNTFLFVLSPMWNLKFLRYKIGTDNGPDVRTITCISGHPTEECVAVGDTSGRIVLWRQLTHYDERQPVKTTFHWHTLPVTEIVFSTSGTLMYSGGGECVLVKWPLENQKKNSFLPRLPAPIRHLTVAPEKGYVAVSTLDNGILIVDAQNKLTAVIQNFTMGITSNPKSLFPAGLAVDPRTNSLVLNGRTGHVQFFNTHTKSLLYNFNITAQNLLTQERNAIIVNTEVTRVAINDDGTWMATMEERDDSVSYPEVRLKFWEFSTDKQSFILNTSIELPHEKGVNALKFRPKSLNNNQQFVVTVGKDDKFKVWHLAESTSDDKKQHWKCYSVGFYRNLPALDAGFSTDGSLIGVGFDSTLTLWVPETSVLKQSLSYCLYRQPIIRVEFGKQECCHLVVVASTEHLAVWDLLSLRVKWSVSLNLTILTADPFSVYMAAFTTDNTLVVFDPGHTDPVYIRKNVVEKDVAVLAACFAPNLQDNEESSAVWQKKSQLHFLNSEQELLTLESKSESKITLENLSASRNLPLTAFSRITAAEKITNTEKPASYVHDYTRLSGKGAVEELLMSVPAHALPPMRMLCMPFLLSLMGTQNNKNKQIEKSSRSNANVEEEELDSDEEEAVTSEEFPLSKDKVDKDAKKEEKLIHFDWDREALF
ncbi:WD repeat-containing protein 75 [Nasonia vitripennis]|uniref:WD repeat-containing protein 75 second beta-propeller domain-containing protein n=1 Tax=Nasonia vitripennis TaxID=7425 RepID=A0A7M7G3H7_NASVI|nr:WD repeat-containing protein 75 [Nasonia vitripennis]